MELLQGRGSELVGQTYRLILLLFSILLFFPMIGQAETGSKLESRIEVLSFLKEAFHAQVSLSEKGRSEEEVVNILKPYFSDSYIQLFKKENIVEEDGKFLTYGSDFAPYYIPYFQFSNQTEIVIKDKYIYVYELFEEEEEGPVTYKDHYEAIILSKNKSNIWRVSDYSYDFSPSQDIISEDAETKIVNLRPYIILNKPFRAIFVHPFLNTKLTSSEYFGTLVYKNK